MQIYSTPKIATNFNNKFLKNNNFNLSFEGYSSSVVKKTTKSKQKNRLEYFLRVVGNKFSDLFQSKFQKLFIKFISTINPTQNRKYLEELADISRIYASQKTFEINIEDKILEQIAQDGKSSIFIMNHSNQSEDPQMLALLNTLLADTYKDLNMDKFPIPKIIMNEDILKTMNPTKRKAFENIGAVGIDANIMGADKDVNVRAFLPLIKGYVKDNCNIFLFPEGRLAVCKNLDFFNRFQPGVASMVDKILNLKKEVRIVPVGFAYGKGDKKDLNSINIGTPIIIKRKDEYTTISQGDILKDKDADLYNFVNKNKDNDDILITKNGEPVSRENIVGYIKTFLAENLEINSKLAQKRIDNSNPEEIIQEI